MTTTRRQSVYYSSTSATKRGVDYVDEDMMDEDMPSPSHSRSGSYDDDDDDDDDMGWDNNDDSSSTSITFAPNVTQETYGGTINPSALAGAAEGAEFSFATASGGLIFPGNASAEGVNNLSDFIKMLRPEDAANIPDTDDLATSTQRRRNRNAKKKGPDHIPRPENAFMLFRKVFVAAKDRMKLNICMEVEGGAKANLSRIIGTTWKHLPLSEKARWEQAAQNAKAVHKMKYPDYRFRPVHDKAKKAARKAAKAEIERKLVVAKVGATEDLDADADDDYVPMSTKKSTSRTTSTSTRPRSRKQPSTPAEERHNEAVARALLKGQSKEKMERDIRKARAEYTREVKKEREEAEAREREASQLERESEEREVSPPTDDSIQLSQPHQAPQVQFRLQQQDEAEATLRAYTQYPLVSHRRSSSVPVPETAGWNGYTGAFPHPAVQQHSYAPQQQYAQQHQFVNSPVGSSSSGTGRMSLSNILAYGYHNLDAYDLHTSSQQYAQPQQQTQYHQPQAMHAQDILNMQSMGMNHGMGLPSFNAAFGGYDMGMQQQQQVQDPSRYYLGNRRSSSAQNLSQYSLQMQHYQQQQQQYQQQQHFLALTSHQQYNVPEPNMSLFEPSYSMAQSSGSSQYSSSDASSSTSSTPAPPHLNLDVDFTNSNPFTAHRDLPTLLSPLSGREESIGPLDVEPPLSAVSNESSLLSTPSTASSHLTSSTNGPLTGNLIGTMEQMSLQSHMEQYVDYSGSQDGSPVPAVGGELHTPQPVSPISAESWSSLQNQCEANNAPTPGAVAYGAYTDGLGLQLNEIGHEYATAY